MRPLKLTAEGLRSIRSKVEVDFTGRDNIAIIGDTGAGKSSLLQAITYALYGRTTYSGKANQELMNDTSTQLRVVLEFTVSGGRWKVARTLRRAGDGRVVPGSAMVVRLGDGDAVVEQVEQVTPVNERIARLLGLDFEAFTRAVLLPQGEFARLLVQDGPTDRSKILQQIWRTDELTALGEATRELQGRLEPELRAVEQQLATEPDDPLAHLARLINSRDEAAGLAGTARTALEEAQAARTTLETARGQTATAAQVTKALGETDLAPLAEQSSGLAETAAGLATRRKTVDEQVQKLRAERDQLPDDADGLTAAGVATARDRLARLPGLVSQLAEQAGEARGHAAEADKARGRAEHARIRAVGLTEKIAERAGPRGELVEAQVSADTRLHNATTVLANARTRADRAAELDSSAVTQAGAAEALARDAQAAQKVAQELAARLEHLQHEFEARRRNEAAVAAAHGLGAGDDCPVCTRELSDTWQPPSGSGAIAETDAALRQAREDHDEARNEATRLKFEANAAANAAIEAQRETDRVAGEVRTLRGELVELLGVDQGELGLGVADALLLDGLRRTCQQHDEAVAAYDAETARQQTEAKQATMDAETDEKQAEELEGQARKCGKRVEETLAELGHLLGGLPDGLVELKLPASVDQLGAAGLELPDPGPATAYLSAREAELDQRAARRRELQDELTGCEQQLGELERELEREVAGPLRGLAGTLDRHRDVIAWGAEKLHSAGMEVAELDLPAQAAGCEPVALTDLAAASRRATETLLAAAGELEQAATREGKAAREVTDRLAGLVELDDGRDADRLVAVLDERHREADFAARRAAEQVRAFEPRLEPILQLIEVRAELSRVCAVVADLATALQPSRFPKWLTLRRSQALLVYASKLLGEMTGGRYAFAELDDEQAEWRVIDADTGMPRSPMSLSGGEQFIASLALALGIVEMMARSGGRLESLWLDEGFGALDRTNLDAAVQALATVSAGGRMVAVITHVQAVAEQVEHVLAVTRGPTGSRLDWLTAAQRFDAADGELSEEVSGAVAGLLS